MKTLDRYLVNHQVRVVTGVLALFILLMFLTRILEDLETMISNTAPPILALEFFVLNVPPAIPQLLPFAFLLGSILTGHNLMRKGEFTGMLAGGVSPRRIFAGVLVFSAISSILLILIWDRVSIPSAQGAKRVIRQIKGQEEKVTNRGMFAMLPNNRMLHVQTYNQPEQVLLGVTVLEFGGRDGMNLIRRIESPRAKLANQESGLWNLEQATERIFYATQILEAISKRASGAVVAASEEAAKLPIPLTRFHALLPCTLVGSGQGGHSLQEGDPKYMTLLQLTDYIRRIREAGERTTHYRYEFNRRLAYPWNCFGLALAGLVIAIRRGGTHIAIEMAIGLLAASAFYTLQTFLDTLATKGIFEPILSGWIPPVLFSAVGLKMLGRAGVQ